MTALHTEHARERWVAFLKLQELPVDVDWRAAKLAQRTDPEAMTAQQQALFDWLLEADLRGRLPKGRHNKAPVRRL